MDEKEEVMPNIGLKTTLWLATDLKSEKSQVGWIDGEDGIPALEEAPEPIKKKILDLDYEVTSPGVKTTSQVTVPVLYTEKQHKILKAMEGKKLYAFLKYPDETAEETGKPLVKYFTCMIKVIDDTKTVENYLRDNLVLYRSGEVLESYGFPTAV